MILCLLRSLKNIQENNKNFLDHWDFSKFAEHEI